LQGESFEINKIVYLENTYLTSYFAHVIKNTTIEIEGPKPTMEILKYLIDEKKADVNTLSKLQIEQLYKLHENEKDNDKTTSKEFGEIIEFLKERGLKSQETK
jgi:hypothetical protein